MHIIFLQLKFTVLLNWMKMWKTKHIYIKTSSPPWSISCSEISFNPWNKHNFSIINICMCQSQGLFQIVENIIFVSTQQIKKKKEKKIREFVLTRGAGPLTTLPWLLYWEPWHGQMNLFSAVFHGTTHPRCVHTAFIP